LKKRPVAVWLMMGRAAGHIAYGGCKAADFTKPVDLHIMDA